jgi:hypothetical protein
VHLPKSSCFYAPLLLQGRDLGCGVEKINLFAARLG